MSNPGFLNKENVNMLWDVISDEDIFKHLSSDNKNKISQIFVDNLQGFNNSEKNKNNLIDMNKKYIILILNFIKQQFIKNKVNKIQIHEELSPTNQKELITYEEIQNDKKTQFERDLNRRQEEFTNAMTIPVPPVPEFNDKFKEQPITEIEKMVKEIANQRNYDVEQINYHNLHNSNLQNNNWLKPQETSVKSEKLQPPPNQNKLEQINTNDNNKLKYLKINNDEITFGNKEVKNVTWGVNEMREINDIEELEEDSFLFEESIFNKLKRVPQNPASSNSNNSNEIKDTNEQSIRITNLEKEMKEINKKIENILTILQTK
jgi:hypothetical protein